MIFTNSRGMLDRWLDNEDLTLLVLTGETNGQKIHDFVIGRPKEAWRRCALIKDVSLLTPDELSKWGIPESGGERYVVLGGDPQKSVGDKDANKDLLRPDGRVSATKLEQAFIRGDKLGTRT